MYKGKELPLSLVIGLIFGILTHEAVKSFLPEDVWSIWILSCFAFLFSFISLYLYLKIHNKRMGKSYEEIEKKINVPIFYQANGNFRIENKVVNGNIYFTEGGILLASFDEKPYGVELLSYGDVWKYETDDVHLTIYTKDDRVYQITVADAKRIIKMLKEKGLVQ